MHPSRFRTRVLWALLAFVPLCTSAAPQWLKLKTKDVVIYSDAMPKDITEFAVNFAAFRHAFRETFHPPQDVPPTTVVIFASKDRLAKILPKSEFKGYVTTTYRTEIDGAALVALGLHDNRARVLETTFEFATMWELQRAGFEVPLWMSQGAGEVLACMELKKDGCHVGNWSSSHGSWGRGDMNWDRFFEITTTSPEYSGEDAEGLFHNQAWALMHRVLYGGESPHASFHALARHLREAPTPKEAVSRFLGVETRDIDRELSRHLKTVRAGARVIPFDAAALRKSLKPEPAIQAEVHIQLANLLFSTGRVDEAEQEIARAQWLAPGSPLLKEARARSAIHARETGEAVRLYREAIELGSTNPAAYLQSAEARLDEVCGGRDQIGAGGIGVDQSAAEIRKAIELDPTNREAYRLLGRALLLSSTVSPENAAELTPGVSQGPTGSAIRFYRAIAFDRCNDTESSLADFAEVAADVFADAKLRESARKYALRIKARSQGSTESAAPTSAPLPPAEES